MLIRLTGVNRKENKLYTCSSFFKSEKSGYLLVSTNSTEQLNGLSNQISHYISSPKGKDRWNKHSLETMLSNEKYKGDVRLLNKRIQGRSGEGKTLIIPYIV